MSATKEDAPYDGLVSPKPEGTDVEKGEIHGASVGMMVIISLPRIATQMAWAAQWAALGPYLSTMLPNFAVQLTQLIGPLTGIFTAPTVGVCSDRSTNKWGRRRPFLVYAAVTSCICWIGMAYTKEMAEGLGDHGDIAHGGSRKWTATFTIILYAWMDITVNVVQTPSQLLIADFAGDRQTLGAGIGQAWSVVGSLLVSLYIALFGPAHQTLKAFMAMLCVIMIVTVAICCFVAKEQPLVTDEEKVSKGAQICEAFKSIGRGLKALPGPLIIYAVVFFCICYGNSAYSGNKGQFFGVILKHGDASGATCGDHCTPKQKAYNDGVQIAGGTADLIYNIEGYVFSWMLPVLVRKFGAKWTLIVSLVPEALLIVMALCRNIWVDVVLVVLTNIAQTAIFTMVVPVIVHVVGDKEDVGMFVGALNSANCIGMLVNFLVGTALVTTSLGYELPVLVGGIVSAVGILIAMFFFKIEMYSL